MATELANFPEWKCPYCGKLLTNDEYNHAVEELRVRAEKEYKEQQRKDREYFEEQKQKLIEKNQEEMDNHR
jgi:sarcosine oxidase delta subunit